MSSKKMKTRAIFLDRDGIINVDHGYVSKIEDFEFNKGIFELLLFLQSQGFLLIVVTNQSGIGRGYYTQEDYMTLTSYMVESLMKEGVKIDAVFHCPHTPEDRCKCRKPQTGMLRAAKKQFDIDMRNSWMIGDKESDMLVGKNAGISNRIYLSKDSQSPTATLNVTNLHEILNIRGALISKES